VQSRALHGLAAGLSWRLLPPLRQSRRPIFAAARRTEAQGEQRPPSPSPRTRPSRGQLGSPVQRPQHPTCPLEQAVRPQSPAIVLHRELTSLQALPSPPHAPLTTPGQQVGGGQARARARCWQRRRHPPPAAHARKGRLHCTYHRRTPSLPLGPCTHSGAPCRTAATLAPPRRVRGGLVGCREVALPLNARRLRPDGDRPHAVRHSPAAGQPRASLQPPPRCRPGA
jgi:hypothetical protein